VARLVAARPRSRLWLLEPDDGASDHFAPWGTGDLFPGDMSDPAVHDPAALPAGWWAEHAERSDPADLAPLGRSWPGFAPSEPPEATPDEAAADCAWHLVAAEPRLRLGLVAASSGAAALTACGRRGSANYASDSAPICAVLATWESRFGARVVSAGSESVTLSVATCRRPTRTRCCLRPSTSR
jgi:hypothetical protein